MSNLAGRTIKALLIDLSGTIHIENEVINGSIEALRSLRNIDLKIKFVTNTTKESKCLLHNRLKALGFDINSEEIFTSLTAARKHVLSKNLRPMPILDERAMEDFKDVPKHDPNCVLIGLAPEKFNYKVLNSAFRLLSDGASLVAIHKARYFKTSEGLSLGPGAFIEGLEFALGKKATVVGKPEPAFFMEALHDLNCKPEDAIMIGDDVKDDIIGAQAIGIFGILVKTGKYRVGDEEGYNGMKPNLVADDFSSAVHQILNHIKSNK